MLEIYFAAPKTLDRLRAGPSGPYLDGFAALLERDGYRPATAVRYLRAAAHLGHFLQDRGGTLADFDLSTFFWHLRTCRCPRSKGGRRNHHTSFGAKRYRASEKLEAIEAIVPPHLRKGSFRAPDKLIALLRAKS